MSRKKKENYGPNPILMWIFVLVLVVVLFFLVNSSLFNVSSITVTGNNSISSREIIDLSGIDYETNILHVDEETAKQNIETNFFLVVEDIERTFPTGVVIKVHERVPVAQIGTINGYYVIDADGITIGLNTVAVDGLTKIYNLGIVAPQGGQKIVSDSEDKLNGVFRVLEAMDKYGLNEKITGIDMNDPRKIVLTYENSITVKIAGGLTADDRLKHLEATVEAVKDKLSEGQSINLESSGGYYIG